MPSKGDIVIIALVFAFALLAAIAALVKRNSEEWSERQ